jgi:hypothetical protein
MLIKIMGTVYINAEINKDQYSSASDFRFFDPPSLPSPTNNKLHSNPQSSTALIIVLGPVAVESKETFADPRGNNATEALKTPGVSFKACSTADVHAEQVIPSTDRNMFAIDVSFSTSASKPTSSKEDTKSASKSEIFCLSELANSTTARPVVKLTAAFSTPCIELKTPSTVPEHAEHVIPLTCNRMICCSLLVTVVLVVGFIIDDGPSANRFSSTSVSSSVFDNDDDAGKETNGMFSTIVRAGCLLPKPPPPPRFFISSQLLQAQFF